MKASCAFNMRTSDSLGVSCKTLQRADTLPRSFYPDSRLYHYGSDTLNLDETLLCRGSPKAQLCHAGSLARVDRTSPDI
jgi:hypothetical protein